MALVKHYFYQLESETTRNDCLKEHKRNINALLSHYIREDVLANPERIKDERIQGEVDDALSQSMRQSFSVINDNRNDRLAKSDLKQWLVKLLLLFKQEVIN